MLKIGNITLDSPLVLAPLSGYTNYALRQLSREFGAELTFPGVFLAKSVAIPKVLSKQQAPLANTSTWCVVPVAEGATT